MSREEKILNKIKEIVHSVEPAAKVILFGSFARGEDKTDSDIDLLILLDKDKLSRQDEKRIKYPLYDLEFDTGKIISPLVFSIKEWESRHSITPLYENIQREGVEL